MTEVLDERFGRLSAIAKDRQKFKKAKRIPISQGDILKAESREGFHRHWIEDRDGEIERYAEAGYAPVFNTSGEEMDTGGNRVGKDSSRPGSVITRSAGNGAHLVLMEIPNSLYEADQRDRHEKIDAKEAKMNVMIDKKDAEDHMGRYGGAKITSR